MGSPGITPDGGVLSLPTRNGNYPWGKIRAGNSKVLSLPTRNGNVNFSLITENLAGMFWAYLQGMETWWAWRAWSGIAKRFWAYLQGMETKKMVFSPAGDVHCFEPTYKEWKQKDGKTYALYQEVLSLPTRNGNAEEGLVGAFFQATFWAYLQGMETPQTRWEEWM